MWKRIIAAGMAAAFAMTFIGASVAANAEGVPNDSACWGKAVSGWDGSATNYGQSVKKDAQDGDRPGLEWPNVRSQYAGTDRALACQ